MNINGLKKIIYVFTQDSRKIFSNNTIKLFNNIDILVFS